MQKSFIEVSYEKWKQEQIEKEYYELLSYLIINNLI